MAWSPPLFRASRQSYLQQAYSIRGALPYRLFIFTVVLSAFFLCLCAFCALFGRACQNLDRGCGTSTFRGPGLYGLIKVTFFDLFLLLLSPLRSLFIASLTVEAVAL